MKQDLCVQDYLWSPLPEPNRNPARLRHAPVVDESSVHEFAVAEELHDGHLENDRNRNFTILPKPNTLKNA